jgi:hypothetical protein
MNQHLFWMGFHLVVAALVLLGFAAFAEWGDTAADWVMRAGMTYAGLDLIATVLGRPLVKAGPIAKAMYPGLKGD